ncbi:MAG: hypothetical protein OXF79_04675, partial [Chloroflexi bacterium]|nr:hypothetical protein [Chloroflexota bacterium]
MLKVKRTRTVGFVAAVALLALLMAGLALALWPAGAVQAQDEEPPPVANLKCEARTDQVRFSWDIPRWSGGETKWYDVEVTLPNGRQFGERRHWLMRSRTDRGKWQPASEARIEVKALYDLPNGDRVSSVASEASCVVPGTPNSAPAVASAIADATIKNESGTHEVALVGVFSDADNDALTITASSSAEAVATATVAADQSALTVAAKSRGTA